jgi:uncharacterized membrane protein (DUF106 family)
MNRSIGEPVSEESGAPNEDSDLEEEDSEDDPEDPQPEQAADSGASGAASTTPPRPTMGISRFIMIFLGLMAVYAIIDPSVGIAFANAANVVLFPLIGFGGNLPVLTILLAGLLTTTVSSVIRDHYTNWVKMARTQRVVRAWSKERFEAMRKGQQTRLQKLQDAQKAFQKDQMEMMTSPYKSMAWTYILFIVVFVWLRLFVDITLSNMGNQWIAVPWGNHVYLNSAYVLPSWILLYSLLAIPFGQIITRVLKYVHFLRRLQAMGLPPRGTEPSEAA